MENSQTGGKTWGIPFQRSTIVMFWNKDAFKEAGLDPNKAPDTWDELVADGGKLTKRDASGNVSQWGVEIPSTGFPYWLFQGLTTANNVRLMNQAGTATYFDKPSVFKRCNIGSISAANTRSSPKAPSSGARRRRISSSARLRSCGPRLAT